MSEKVKFAVIGQGHIGKRHAEMIRRNNDLELIAVCDTLPKDEIGIVDFKEKYYRSAEAMLAAHPEVEMVSVCSPNGLHVKHSLMSLDADKHVICEKPLALTKADCEKIILKALKKNKTVFCVMQNRYSPPSKWLKEIVAKKIIGDVFLVQLNCYWNRDDRYYKKGGWKGTQDLDGGTLFTQFSHFIDIMYWLFGDVKDIQAKFNDFTHAHSTAFEDSGFVNFNFVDGGIGCINYSTAVWDTNLDSSITIVGSKGSVKVGGQYMDKVEYCHIKDYIIPNFESIINEANSFESYKGSANNHYYFFENVVETLRCNKGVNTDAIDELKVIDIIERIYSLRRPDRKG